MGTLQHVGDLQGHTDRVRPRMHCSRSCVLRPRPRHALARLHSNNTPAQCRVADRAWQQVWSVAWSTSGKRLASCGGDKCVRCTSPLGLPCPPCPPCSQHSRRAVPTAGGLQGAVGHLTVAWQDLGARRGSVGV